MAHLLQNFTGLVYALRKVPDIVDWDEPKQNSLDNFRSRRSLSTLN